jgi:hypothetical protein
MEGEEPSLYHFLRAKKRCDTRTVRQVQDKVGITHMAPVKILKTFTTYLPKKYDVIPVNSERIKVTLCNITTKLPPEAHIALDAPITMDELQHAIQKGKPQKAPGCDGISHDFYKATWEMNKDDMLTIINQMYKDGQIADTQKRGMLICIPKIPNSQRPDDYRPLTLLNADYKLLTRILATRLRPWLASILHPGQHCGISGPTVYEELATVRDAIAYAAHSRKPLCILSLDFKEAFNNISHTYLFSLLQAYGFSTHFQQRVQDMYMGATSQVKINGYVSGPIPIKCSIRQGCQLSMALFALCLDPLLTTIAKTLPGIRIGRHHATTTVLAYADDINILMTSPHDIPLLQTILDDYAATTGDRINIGKSKALAISTWDTTVNVMQIPYVADMKILGICFTSTVNQSARISWSQVTGGYNQWLMMPTIGNCLDRRILHVHSYVLATAWYTAQIFLIPAECVRQINSATAWHLWRGEVFRVPMSTLLREKQHGGWDLVNIAAKSQILFFCCLHMLSNCDGMLTHDWLRSWTLHKPASNPPNIQSIPDSIEYLCIYAMDTAYIPPWESLEP